MTLGGHRHSGIAGCGLQGAVNTLQPSPVEGT